MITASPHKVHGITPDREVGIILFSSLVMMPQFLQTLLGYTAQSAGLVLSASGVVLLFEIRVLPNTELFPLSFTRS